MNTTTILVPLDGSKFAECALPFAIEMADRLSASIELVCVVPDIYAGWKRSAETFPAEELDSPDLEPSDYLDLAAKWVKTATSAQVLRTVLTGPAAKQLVTHSEMQEPALIVMSTHGRGPLRRAWLGSVADWVVRHASMPVLLVRPEEGADVELTNRQEFNNVLVALDGSRQAEESLRWAKAIGGEHPTLTLVRVARNSIPAWTVDTMHVPSYVDNRDYTKAAHTESTEYLSGVEHLVRNGSQNVASVVVDGVSAAEGILETAERKAADLIAITTHGRGGLPRLILGSVADKVVRASHAPVLVVRPTRT
ncbi:universal stress protein [Gemmatimonadota bacterium]